MAMLIVHFDYDKQGPTRILCSNFPSAILNSLFIGLFCFPLNFTAAMFRGWPVCAFQNQRKDFGLKKTILLCNNLHHQKFEFWHWMLKARLGSWTPVKSWRLHETKKQIEMNQQESNLNNIYRWKNPRRPDKKRKGLLNRLLVLFSEATRFLFWINLPPLPIVPKYFGWMLYRTSYVMNGRQIFLFDEKVGMIRLINIAEKFE